MRIAVSGASGFIGQMLCDTLVSQGYTVRAVLRRTDSAEARKSLDVIAVGDLNGNTPLSEALADVQCLFHCAALTNARSESGLDDVAAYFTVNVAGTRRLAEQAAVCGVRRLVFLSSIKVNGERTANGRPFARSSQAAPEDAYGHSKLEAERALWKIAADTGLEVVVVRPPAVYGPRVRGNLLRLINLVASGIPLPLGMVDNRRSLIGLRNLVDVLLRCAIHPSAAGQTLLVSDGQDLSTRQLIRLIAEGLGTSARLLPVPVSLLRSSGSIFGMGPVIHRLIDSLQLDVTHTREILGWIPPVSIQDGLAETLYWYKRDRHRD